MNFKGLCSEVFKLTLENIVWQINEQFLLGMEIVDVYTIKRKFLYYVGKHKER